MGYKISITTLAAQDLDSIVQYIDHKLENPMAAFEFLAAMEVCYGDLETMPLMYEQCRDPRLRAMGYRRAVIKNYVMVYKVDEQAKTVFVLRFFYGAQDYEKLI